MILFMNLESCLMNPPKTKTAEAAFVLGDALNLYFRKRLAVAIAFLVA